MYGKVISAIVLNQPKEMNSKQGTFGYSDVPLCLLLLLILFCFQAGQKVTGPVCSSNVIQLMQSCILKFNKKESPQNHFVL